jgi:hypothetical protein
MLSEEQRSDRRSGQGVCDGPELQRVAFQTTRQIYFPPEHNLRNKTGLLCSPEHGAGAIAPPSRRIDLPQCRAALWAKAIHIARGLISNVRLIEFPALTLMNVKLLHEFRLSFFLHSFPRVKLSIAMLTQSQCYG